MTPFASFFKPLLVLLLLAGASACNGGSGPDRPSGSETDTMAIREATDPVPEPVAQPDTGSNQPLPAQGAEDGGEELFRITGTEPFWSLTISTGYSMYRSMEGDSIRFAYREPVQAAGRQPEWVQLYQLDRDAWVLLRRGNTPCSDGMSDTEWAYTATLWLRGRLLDGCGEKR